MAKSAKKQKLAWNGEVLTITYPGIKKQLVVDVSEYSDEIRTEAMLHGFKQKFGDAASGRSAAEKFEEASAIHASLRDGEWERTANPDPTPMICAAVARIKKLSLQDVLDAAEKVGEEKVREWGSTAKVKAEILKIRAERLEAEAGSDDEDVDIEI